MSKRNKRKSFFQRLRNFFIGGYRQGGIVGLYHWIRCHTIHRYHIINISKEDEYDWGWIDRDSALLLANFKILKDFVEKESPDIGLQDYETFLKRCYNPEFHDESTLKMINNEFQINKEIRELYDWWHVGRVKDSSEIRNTKNYKKMHQLQDAFDKKEDEMLLRLIKVRHYLWT